MKKRIVGIGTAMAIIIAIALVSPVSAAHYHMDVTTDHTRWSIDRSTLPVSFELSGTVTGNGTMIQDHDIALAGVRKNSLIYTRPGEVTTCEDLDVNASRPGEHNNHSHRQERNGKHKRSLAYLIDR